MSKETAVRRGDAARQALQNEALVEAIKFMDAKWFERFRNAKTPEEVWYARCDWQARQDFITTLHTFFVQGEHAAKEEQTLQDKMREENKVRAKTIQKYNQAAALARAKWIERTGTAADTEESK